MSIQRVILSVCLCAIVILFFKRSFMQEERGKILTIGIVQTATHLALDRVREGFISQMEDKAFGEVRFIVKNSEGSSSKLNRIAKEFHSQKKVDAIFAVGTLAAQVVAKIEKEKPVFIAAVSEPSSLELQNNINVCGTSDQVNTEAHAKLILRNFPQARKVSILFNPHESSSLMCVERMRKSLESVALEYSIFGVSSEKEVEQATIKASEESDVILLPLDNLLAATMPLISRTAMFNKRPLIVSDICSVSNGALIGQGADYFDSGKKTADIAYKVLFLKESPSNFGITKSNSTKILVNKKVADIIEFTIERELTQFIAEL